MIKLQKILTEGLTKKELSQIEPLMTRTWKDLKAMEKLVSERRDMIRRLRKVMKRSMAEGDLKKAQDHLIGVKATVMNLEQDIQNAFRSLNQTVDRIDKMRRK